MDYFDSKNTHLNPRNGLLSLYISLWLFDYLSPSHVNLNGQDGLTIDSSAASKEDWEKADAFDLSISCLTEWLTSEAAGELLPAKALDVPTGGSSKTHSGPLLS